MLKHINSNLFYSLYPDITVPIPEIFVKLKSSYYSLHWDFFSICRTVSSSQVGHVELIIQWSVLFISSAFLYDLDLIHLRRDICHNFLWRKPADVQSRRVYWWTASRNVFLDQMILKRLIGQKSAEIYQTESSMISSQIKVILCLCKLIWRGEGYDLDNLIEDKYLMLVIIIICWGNLYFLLGIRERIIISKEASKHHCLLSSRLAASLRFVQDY